MTEPTPPTETRVGSPGREVSRVEARTPPAGDGIDGIDGPEIEITFPYCRVRKSELWKYETEKAYLRVVLFTKA